MQDRQHKFYMECDDQCGALVFGYWEWDTEDKELYISYLTPNFYSQQRNWPDSFKRAVKLAWSILTGKEFRLYELIISDKQLEEFKKFVSSINFEKPNG